MTAIYSQWPRKRCPRKLYKALAKNFFFRCVSLLTPLTCSDRNRTTMKRRYGAATSRKPRFKTATRVSRQTQIQSTFQRLLPRGKFMPSVKFEIVHCVAALRQGVPEPPHSFDLRNFLA